MAIFLNSASHTEEGERFELTAEMEEKCKLVYKLDDKGGAAFAGFWNPEAEYSDEYAILPVRSSYGGKVDLIADTIFVNVLGSTPDTDKGIPGGEESWIALYTTETKREGVSCCAYENCIYDPSDDTQIKNDVLIYNRSGKFACGGNLCGGHVLVNEKDSMEVDEVDRLP